MFNIGFSEMLVIAVIALIVVGPDKLPELARTLGKWVGAAKRVFGEVKAEVDQQIMMDDIIRHNRAIMDMDAIPSEKKAENGPADSLREPDEDLGQVEPTAAKMMVDDAPDRPAASGKNPQGEPAPERIH